MMYGEESNDKMYVEESYGMTQLEWKADEAETEPTCGTCGHARECPCGCGWCHCLELDEPVNASWRGQGDCGECGWYL